MTHDRVPTIKLGPASGPMLRPARAAAYLGLSLSTFYEQIKSGELPPLVKVGLRASAMPQPWLDTVIAHRANMQLSCSRL